MDEAVSGLMITQWDAVSAATRDEWQNIISTVSLPPLISDFMPDGTAVDEFDPRELSALAQRDPVLGGKLIAVANSAKFGLTTPMTSVQRAIVHLGFNLVKTIMLAYQFESTFSSIGNFSKQHLHRVRQWSSCASVIAFLWGQAADVSDPSTSATVALLTRLGTLLLGLAQPELTDEYWDQPDEISRLQYEQSRWGVTTYVLSQRLAEQWGLPASLQTMLSEQWKPLMDGVQTTYATRSLALICAANLLAGQVVLTGNPPSGDILDRPEYNMLKLNLAANHLLEHLHDVLISNRLHREISGCLA